MEGYKVEGIRIDTVSMLAAMTGGEWQVCSYDDFMAAIDATNLQCAPCACA